MLLVLNSLVSLTQYLHDYLSVLFDILVVLIEIEEKRDERRLSVGGHECINLILYSLYARLEFVLEPGTASS